MPSRPDQTSATEQNFDEERLGSKAIRWGKRANQARNAYGWWGWLFGGGTGNALVGTTGLAIATASAGLLLNDTASNFRGVPRPVTVQAMTVADREALGEDAVLYQVTGKDQAGRSATFDIIVLSRATVWVKGSTKEISRDGQTLDSAAFRSTVLGGALGERIKASLELIAVGVASIEGDQATEETRAGQRAERIAGWLADVSGSGKPIWALNLGQHRANCSSCDEGVTDWQRPIIVVGLVKGQSGVDRGQALADAMSTRANLPSPESYSKFTLAKIR